MLYKTAKEIARNIILSPYHFEKHARNHILNQFKYTFKDVKQGWYNYIYGHKSSVLGGGFLLNPFILGGAGDIGGWKQIGKVTAEGNVASLTTPTFTSKRFYMMFWHAIGNAYSGNVMLRLGDTTVDSGPNYAFRNSLNGNGGSVDNYYNTQPQAYETMQNQAGRDGFGVHYVANLSSKNKLGISHTVDNRGYGANNIPDRLENVFKWSKDTELQKFHIQDDDLTARFAQNSEILVLGLDPADTHTDNFWGQLFSPVEVSSGTSIDSGTFTAKKYCRLMAYAKKGSGDMRTQLRMGNSTIDTNPNYALRRSEDGGADEPFDQIGVALSGSGLEIGATFWDIFIINVSSKEKLVIAHSVTQNTAGANTAPQREEQVGKWSNISNQANRFEIFNDQGGNFASGSILAGWGND